MAFRSCVQSMVLHTDMRTHMAGMSQMEETLAQKRATGGAFDLASKPADRQLLLDTVLHAADLGNPAKPLRLGLTWARLIMIEYFSQGDAERDAGLPISPMCDRNRPTLDVQQHAFLKLFVLPLYTQLAEAMQCAPSQLLERVGGAAAASDVLSAPLSNLLANRSYYANRMQHRSMLQQHVQARIAAGAKAATLKPGAVAVAVVTPDKAAGGTAVAGAGVTKSCSPAEAEAEAERASYVIQDEEAA